jgi:uncharacterized membrane protein YccF (DUF307 family)
MWSLVAKIGAVLVAIGYVLATAISERAVNSSVIGVCVLSLASLALIWFPEEIGSYTGYVGRGGSIDTETPSVLVSLAGWFLLIGFPILAFVVGR